MNIDVTNNQVAKFEQTSTNQEVAVRENEKIQVQASETKETIQLPAQSIQKTEKVDMTQTEMTVRTNELKTNQAQDTIASKQIAQQALSTIQEQGKKLTELSSKHQEAKSEDKVEIEQQAKEVIKSMKKTVDSATFKGHPVIEESVKEQLDKHATTADVKEVLKPAYVAEHITKPVEVATKRISTEVETMVASLSASQAVSVTKSEAQLSMDKLKESLRDTDVEKVASGMDDHRVNVAHLLN